MKTRLVLLSIAAVLVLSACGNKGPLFLPEKPPADAAPASPSEEKKNEAPPIDPATDTPPAAEPAPPVQQEDG